MDGSESVIEIIIVTLKECIARTNFFGNKHRSAAKIIQTMDDCKFSCQKNIGPLEEWIIYIYIYI